MWIITSGATNLGFMNLNVNEYVLCAILRGIIEITVNDVGMYTCGGGLFQNQTICRIISCIIHNCTGIIIMTNIRSGSPEQRMTNLIIKGLMHMTSPVINSSGFRD